jgi:hypothetical protein
MTARAVNKYKEDYDVYIGRGSIWGNPYSHKEGTKAKHLVATREEAVEKYREYVLGNKFLLSQLHKLRGKRLGCFCAPQACHGDVLAELADNLVP